VTLLRKKSLVNFDLRDETGTAVPLIGLRQTQRLHLRMLEDWAEVVLGGQGNGSAGLRDGEQLSGALRADIRRIVCGSQDDIEQGLDAFIEPSSMQHEALYAVHSFRSILRTLDAHRNRDHHHRAATELRHNPVHTSWRNPGPILVASDSRRALDRAGAAH
jgi:hypothetical protein